MSINTIVVLTYNRHKLLQRTSSYLTTDYAVSSSACLALNCVVTKEAVVF
jgi:hypothetical protein